MRKLIILFLALGILGATAYGGRRVYRHWKTQRALSAAKTALAKSDYIKGGLWLRKAVSANANNVDAVRLMGDFTELIHSPSAVFWRDRLVRLEPNSFTNQIMLARAAIAAKEFETARKALDGVEERGRTTAEYFRMMGTFANATEDYLQAETNFAQACVIEPQNPLARLSLAGIRIHRKNPELVAEARQILETLRTDPAVRSDALRHLVFDALRHTNYDRAVPFVRELVSVTNVLLDDRLIELNVLQAATNPQFPSTFAALQREASTNALSTFSLARWMLASTTPNSTLAWLETIQPEIRTNLPVTIVVADCHLGNSNWISLEGWVGKQQWGELDYLRFAFSARALREQNLGTAAKAAWTKAIKAAEGRLDRLEALERLAAKWRWTTELEEVLWIVVTKFPAEKDAMQSLSQLLFVTGKTRSLLTLMAQASKADPGNLASKNNLAATALLLNASEYKPHELALEVYEKQPDNSSYASTYAYSLYLQKKTREARQVMEKLSPEMLQQPAVAGYYAVMLGASGDKDKAKDYLKLAATARVLPEEKQLFERAAN